MVELKDYIKESLLDDEDILMKKDEAYILSSEIQSIIGKGFEVTEDKKYIIYSIMSNSIEFGDDAISLDDLKKINKYKLKFQPIRKIRIDDRDLNGILKELNSVGCGWLCLTQSYNNSLLDLSNLEFPTKMIEYSAKYWDIIPPKHHVNFVFLRKYIRGVNDGDWKNIKGWNCDSLMILADDFEIWDNDRYIVGNFDKEKLQILIDNNPGVKEFLLTDGLYNRYLFKVNYKGSKRIVDKIVKKSLKYTDKYIDEVNKYNEDVVKKFEKYYDKDNKPFRLYK